MKRFILLLVVGIISASCSKENLQSDLKPQFSVNSETEQPVYYQSSTGQYFIHQHAPFDLDNMQAAYDYWYENLEEVWPDLDPDDPNPFPEP